MGKSRVWKPPEGRFGHEGPLWLPGKIVMGVGDQCARPWDWGVHGYLVEVAIGWDRAQIRLCFAGGAVAQQVPVQAIQVHQAPQQASPSRDSSTDLTQTSSSGTGIARSPVTLPPCLPPRGLAVGAQQ